ncbi:MAG: lytic transglycosylase domain-containing protein [Clostridia bacterium]|nr:lytic transglycosylase domain-containing protein [Clostridia bacterium]MDD4387474.1 lytic transglycosylase domain-containing protein [Clostridia bacterium]
MKKIRIIFKIVFAILVVCVLLYVYCKTFIYKATYLEYIEKNCAGSSIDPYLVLSIIKVESGFNSNAISNKEAKGLMQIKDTTYNDVADIFTNIDDKINLYDPETNLKIGIAYFKRLVNKYDGNYYIALLAYNAGMGNVNNWINTGIIPKNLDYYVVPNIPFNETKNYLKKVMTTYKTYKFLYVL